MAKFETSWTATMPKTSSNSHAYQAADVQKHKVRVDGADVCIW